MGYATTSPESLLDKTLEQTDPSSHNNSRFLTTAEKSQRLQQLHHQHRLTQKKQSRLQKKLRDVDQQAIPVDEDTDSDVRTMMAEEKKSMFDN